MRSAGILLLFVTAVVLATDAAAEDSGTAVAPAADNRDANTVIVNTVVANAVVVNTAATTAAAAAPPYAARLREQAQQVLQGKDFHDYRESRQLVMRDWLRQWLKKESGKQEKPTTPFNLSGMAQLLKVVLALLLALALLWLLWRGWRWLGPRGGTRQAVSQTLPDLQVLALAQETLPEKISTAARAAWQRGDATRALSLLYRGAVQALGERYHIELPASATEGECLRLAKRSGQAVANDAFAPIVRAWTALAYARRPPEDFDALAALYARHFEGSAAGGGV